MKPIFLSSLLLMFSHGAIAGLINFEDTLDSGWYQQSIQTGDYQFDKNQGWMGVNDYSSWLPAGADNNTRDIEMGYGDFTLTHQDGNEFNLQSLDAGLSWYNDDNTDILSVTGYDSNGDMVATIDLTLNHEYQTFELNNFSDLSFVIFDGNAIDTGYVALDNLYLDPAQSQSLTTPPNPPPVAAPVPEPMMLPLFLLGLLGVVKFTRLSPRTCT